MTSGATHQAGSQRVTVSSLVHPRPTFDMGRDERGILPLIQSQEIRSNVLFGLEQRVPALKHSCDCSVSSKVGRYDWCTACLNAS
jgi:hypothetical protein